VLPGLYAGISVIHRYEKPAKAIWLNIIFNNTKDKIKMSTDKRGFKKRKAGSRFNDQFSS
jgi:hypothetical protein